MAHRLVKVLKKKQVSCVGTVRLGPESAVIPVRTQLPSAQTDLHAECPDPVPQQARIVESNSEYAIIEVVCGCGRKCHIQCNYADVMAAENAAR